MVENQSDNTDKVVSDRDIVDDPASNGNEINEIEETSKGENLNINDEDIKNTISNNDARLEQLEKEHEL